MAVTTHPSRRDVSTGIVLAGLMLSSGQVRGDADNAIVPFTYRASDEALRDLHRRLEQTRWPEGSIDEGWQEGPSPKAVRELVDYWRHAHQWRNAEAELQRWSSYRTRIDDLNIHFIHVRSPHPGALPIILTHGWPSTILLFRKIIAPLTDPTNHGGAAADAFDVVIPSLPGFGFSDKPSTAGWNADRTARAWAKLMERLGYTRYIAQGGDWGAYVTTAMAQQKPAGLAAIHLNFAQTIPDTIPDHLTPDEQRAIEARRVWLEQGGAYFQLQATRPQLAGYLLADSPVAQAAWIYDIFNGGTGNTGEPERFLSRDDMLDEITLYWLTNSAASSARFYREQVSLLGKRNNPGRVDLPVSVSVFPHDLPAARSWANDVYPNLFYWNELDRGGHFPQLEVPDLFVQEIRNSLRTMRG